MREKSNAASGGIGFFGALTILFIGLKLTHVINWSWWWVFAPLWIPVGVYSWLLIAIFLIAVSVAWVANVRDAFGSDKRKGEPYAGKTL